MPRWDLVFHFHKETGEQTKQEQRSFLPLTLWVSWTYALSLVESDLRERHLSPWASALKNRIQMCWCMHKFKCTYICICIDWSTFAKKTLSAQSHTTIARNMEQIILNACNYRTEGSYFWEQQIPAIRVSLLVWLFQMIAERVAMDSSGGCLYI